MKIKKLQIKNFQSHKDTTLAFDEGLNVIVGSTNTGKSAILRALKKVIRDTPSGNNFVNVDEKECVINVTTENDTITRRIAVSSNGDTKTNEYILNGVLFAKFGKEVPIEIINALRMSEIDFDTIKLDLNFADQLEGPFLLTSPPSLKAKVLGKLTGVDVLDRSIIQTNKYLRQLSGEIKNYTGEIQKLEKELSEFIDIQKCDEELNNLKQLLNKVEQDILLLEKLQILKLNLDAVVTQGKRVKKDVEKLGIVDTITFDDIEKTFVLFQKTNDLNVQIKDIDIKEKRLQIELERFQSIQEIDFSVVESVVVQLERTVSLENELVIFDEIKTCEKGIENLNMLIGTKVKELKMFLEILKVCPTCGQELSNNVINEIVKE